jgi:hypothetical protein
VLAIYSFAELETLVPAEFFPCQYQVTPDTGLLRVSVFEPHVLFDIVGFEGGKGALFIVTVFPTALLQHLFVLFLARK